MTCLLITLLYATITTGQSEPTAANVLDQCIQTRSHINHCAFRAKGEIRVEDKQNIILHDRYELHFVIADAHRRWHVTRTPLNGRPVEVRSCFGCTPDQMVHTRNVTTMDNSAKRHDSETAKLDLPDIRFIGIDERSPLALFPPFRMCHQSPLFESPKFLVRGGTDQLHQIVIPKKGSNEKVLYKIAAHQNGPRIISSVYESDGRILEHIQFEYDLIAAGSSLPSKVTMLSESPNRVVSMSFVLTEYHDKIQVKDYFHIDSLGYQKNDILKVEKPTGGRQKISFMEFDGREFVASTARRYQERMGLRRDESLNPLATELKSVTKRSQWPYWTAILICSAISIFCAFAVLYRRSIRK